MSRGSTNQSPVQWSFDSTTEPIGDITELRKRLLARTDWQNLHQDTLPEMKIREVEYRPARTLKDASGESRFASGSLSMDSTAIEHIDAHLLKDVAEGPLERQGKQSPMLAETQQLKAQEIMPPFASVNLIQSELTETQVFPATSNSDLLVSLGESCAGVSIAALVDDDSMRILRSKQSETLHQFPDAAHNEDISYSMLAELEGTAGNSIEASQISFHPDAIRRKRRRSQSSSSQSSKDNEHHRRLKRGDDWWTPELQKEISPKSSISEIYD